jgi:hypothetical protein
LEQHDAFGRSGEGLHLPSVRKPERSAIDEHEGVVSGRDGGTQYRLAGGASVSVDTPVRLGKQLRCRRRFRAKLYQIDAGNPASITSVTLGDGTPTSVGAPSLDLLNAVIYVGTDQGIIYAVDFPLP